MFIYITHTKAVFALLKTGTLIVDWLNRCLKVGCILYSFTYKFTIGIILI